MVRLVLAAATLVMLAGTVLASVWTGRLLERAAVRRQTDRLDPQTYHEMANFIRLTLGAQPVDDPAYIPEWMKAQGQPILRKIGTARRAGR